MEHDSLAALIIAAVPQRSHRLGNGLRSGVRPADLQAASLLAIAAADASQRPPRTITLKASPPTATFQLNGDGFLRHELIANAAMLICQLSNQ